MIDVPAFRSHYRVEALDRERVTLHSDDGLRVLNGRLCGLVVPLIDGLRNSAAIAEALEGQARPEEVYYALILLEQMGCIRQAGSTLPAGHAAFWESLGISEGAAADRLGRVRIGVAALSRTQPDSFIRAAEEAGLTVGDDAELLVVLAHDYSDPSLDRCNREALEQRRAWMLVKPAGRIQWLGPILRPGVTACWACLAHPKKRLLLWVAAVTVLLAVAAVAADVSGKWKAEFTSPDGEHRVNTFSFKVDSGKLTGTVTGTQDETPIQNGKVNGDEVSFSAERPFGSFTYRGKVIGDEIKFKVEFNGQSFEMTAKRVSN